MESRRGACGLALAALLSLSACPKTVDDRESSDVDFSNPKRVLSSVFHAAKTGDAQHLSTLCDPEGKANEDTQRICRLSPQAPDWQSFVRHFQNAHLIGEARIAGDRALVNFAFGPDGTKTETMELVKRGSNWYLLAF